MEVVAGIAGVAGVVEILSLVGQAVHGILKLKEFARRVSTASETVKSFLEAMDSLENALKAISDLLKRAPEEWLVGTEAQNTKRLASQVAGCRADIDVWVNEMTIHDTNSPRAISSFIRKLQVASHEDTYSKFHMKVARHLQGMQMTLDILGCSYNIHGLERAGVIAGDISDLAEAQRSFNHEVIQNFSSINESFSAHLSPVSSQLDRLENSSQMSSASISSLASDVSRLLELVSAKPALPAIAKSDDAGMVSDAEHSAKSTIAKTNLKPLKFPQQLSETKIEWSCDFLPGIEAAFSETSRYCLYCGNDFDDSEWPLKGRHLVDEHKYGNCNLCLRYDSEEKFAQHLQEFHQCPLGHIWHLSNKLIDKHCQFGRETGFHRGLESEDQHLIDDFHSIRSQHRENLFNNGRTLIERHNHSDGAGFVPPPGSVQHIQPVQRPSELGLYTALFEEACIVDGFYEFDGLCDSFLETTKLLRTDDTNKKPELVDAKPPEKSLTTSGSPMDPLDRAEISKERSRINLWLQEILKSSSTTSIIIFHMLDKHVVNLSDMYTWLEKALELWELDEAATKLDEPESRSDGAVDSRGSPEIQDVEDREYAKQPRKPLGWRPHRAPSAPSPKTWTGCQTLNRQT